VHSFSRESGNKYAVIGVFLDDGANIPNSAFSKLLDDLPSTDDWENQELNINFDWSEIIQNVDLGYYWSYSGSFTTPGCDEDVQWTVLRDIVEVTPTQIEQIVNSSGVYNNFRPPKPLYGRVIEDGSDIINFSVNWKVTACCMEMGDVHVMTSSVSAHLGLSAQDLQIIYFSEDSHRSWDITYEINVIGNTKNYFTYLLRNLDDEDFMVNIKAQIYADSGIPVSTFDSVSVAVVHTYSKGNDNVVAIIICILLGLLLFSVAFARNMKKIKMDKDFVDQELISLDQLGLAVEKSTNGIALSSQSLSKNEVL
jgi:hypothetical protein